MNPAVVCVRRPSGAAGTFLAEHAETRDGLLIAVGHWKEDSARPSAGEYAWPPARILEVRWGAEQ